MINDERFLNVALAVRGRVLTLSGLLHVLVDKQVFDLNAPFPGNKPFMDVLRDGGYSVLRENVTYKTRLKYITGDYYVFDISIEN